MDRWGVAMDRLLVDILCEPSMPGDLSTLLRKEGKIPCVPVVFVKVPRRERSLPASATFDVIRMYVKTRIVGQMVPEAIIMKTDRFRNHVGQQKGKRQGCGMYLRALCPCVDVGNLFHQLEYSTSASS
jgi:hypothetical protein